MTTSRRQLEDAARRRFIFGAATYCSVDGCDRPGAAHDLDDRTDACFLHILERIGLIASFPAVASLPSKVVEQRTCELCDEPAVYQIVLDFRSYGIESRQGGGFQHEWPVCKSHTGATPMWVNEKGYTSVTLRSGVDIGSEG